MTFRQSRVVGALIAGLLLAGCVQAQRPEASASPAALPVPTVALPVSPVPTLRLEPGAPTATPLPDRGVRIETPREVVLQWAAMPAQSIFQPVMGDGTLVATARFPDGSALVAVDLASGHVRRITQAGSAAVQPPRASGGRIAWIEPAPDLSRDVSRLRVLEPGQDQAATIAQGLLYQLDLNGDLVAWQEYRSQGWGIYGYDLRTRAEYVIADEPGGGSFPQICGRQWVAYLHAAREGGTAELRAHDVVRDLDIMIGQVFVPNDGSTGHQHVCDGNRLAWIAVGKQQIEGQERYGAVQHLYDFATGRDRVLDMPVSGTTMLQMKGNLLIGIVGYDLTRDVPFDINFRPPFLWDGRSLAVDDDQLVFVFSRPDGGPQRIYATTIQRDPQKH